MSATDPMRKSFPWRYVLAGLLPRRVALERWQFVGALHPYDPFGDLHVRSYRNGVGIQKMPAYLEATSRRSVPLYQRHGFEILGTVQINDTSPAITPMLRKPN